MPSAVEEFIAKRRTGRAARAGHLQVIPLLGSAPRGPRPRPMARNGSLRMTERDGQARLEEVQAYNGTRRAVMALEGELLRGGYQDRVVAATVVVEPQSAGIIPTACSEEGRFEGDVRLHPSGTVASPRYRCRLRLGHYGRAGGNGVLPQQEAVWDSIEADRRLLDLPDSGISLLRLHETLADRCRQLRARVPAPRDACGWLFFVDGRFMGADLFPGPALAASYRDPLLDAAAYDAVVEGLHAGPVVIDSRPDGDGVAEFWEALRDEMRQALVVREDNGPYASHLCFESPALAGTLLLHRARPLHLSVFPALYPDDIVALA